MKHGPLFVLSNFMNQLFSWWYTKKWKFSVHETLFLLAWMHLHGKGYKFVFSHLQCVSLNSVRRKRKLCPSQRRYSCVDFALQHITQFLHRCDFRGIWMNAKTHHLTYYLKLISFELLQSRIHHMRHPFWNFKKIPSLHQRDRHFSLSAQSSNKFLCITQTYTFIYTYII